MFCFLLSFLCVELRCGVICVGVRRLAIRRQHSTKFAGTCPQWQVPNPLLYVNR